MGFCFQQWINVLQGWVFIFRFGMMFSSVGFPFTSHRTSTQGWVFILWHGMVSSRVTFPFLHHHIPTTVAICFGAQAFSHIGFRRKKKKMSKVTVIFIIENLKWLKLSVVVCWWAQGDEVACHMWKLCKKLWERVWHQNYPVKKGYDWKFDYIFIYG